MTDLLVCRAPGDELADFGGLLLSRPPGGLDLVAVAGHPLRPARAEGERVLQAAGRAAGVREARLLSFAHFAHDPVDPALIAEALGPLDGYRHIYTHSVQDPRPLCARIAAAVGSRAQEVWTVAGGGVVDQVIRSPAAQFARRMALLSEHYPDLLAEDLIAARELRDVLLLQRHAGDHLYRYFRGYVEWHPGEFDYASPWALESSAYEERRYAAELEVLHRFPWQRLVEVGACEGAFTERIRAAFPERQVIAFEPDPWFFERLRRRVGESAETRRRDAEAAGAVPCDVLLFSSAIYYLWKMPYRMLRNARHVVVSHARRFHRDRLDNFFLAQGFETIHRAEVPACVEPMEGILEVKYGTEIRVWRRG
jgi:hypothetical protein